MVATRLNDDEQEVWKQSILRAKDNLPEKASGPLVALLEGTSGHHHWTETNHPRPTFCNYCREKLNGVPWHGYTCDICKVKAHRKCRDNITEPCKWTNQSSIPQHLQFISPENSILPHQWMEGNLPMPAKCSVCEKPCGSVRKLVDYRCIWCGCCVHDACIGNLARSCSLGHSALSVISPLALKGVNSNGTAILREEAKTSNEIKNSTKQCFSCNTLLGKLDRLMKSLKEDANYLEESGFEPGDDDECSTGDEMLKRRDSVVNRANSLKKALREVISMAEKGIDQHYRDTNTAACTRRERFRKKRSKTTPSVLRICYSNLSSSSACSPSCSPAEEEETENDGTEEFRSASCKATFEISRSQSSSSAVLTALFNSQSARNFDELEKPSIGTVHPPTPGATREPSTAYDDDVENWPIIQGYIEKGYIVIIGWYYMIETGFYYSLLIASSFDVRRSDFWQLMVHHVITIFLLSSSWTINFVRVGTLILLSHDISDVFLEGGKLVRYDAHNKNMTNFMFVLFFTSWVLTRLIYYPFIVIRSAVTEAAALIQPDYVIWDLGLMIVHMTVQETTRSRTFTVSDDELLNVTRINQEFAENWDDVQYSVFTDELQSRYVPPGTRFRDLTDEQEIRLSLAIYQFNSDAGSEPDSPDPSSSDDDDDEDNDVENNENMPPVLNQNRAPVFNQNQNQVHFRQFGYGRHIERSQLFENRTFSEFELFKNALRLWYIPSRSTNKDYKVADTYNECVSTENLHFSLNYFFRFLEDVHKHLHIGFRDIRHQLYNQMCMNFETERKGDILAENSENSPIKLPKEVHDWIHTDTDNYYPKIDARPNPTSSSSNDTSLQKTHRTYSEFELFKNALRLWYIPLRSTNKDYKVADTYNEFLEDVHKHLHIGFRDIRHQLYNQMCMNFETERKGEILAENSENSPIKLPKEVHDWIHTDIDNYYPKIDAKKLHFPAAKFPESDLSGDETGEELLKSDNSRRPYKTTAQNLRLNNPK
ncbi:hypothetical protein CRE_19468 [Caenorhabditis remanei]|uniref:diacylglycerol kinase (ATP) n=1 Tax=Caenorhabditis remanei TaxID=31234 RepID=E3NDI6_CAERE|nr:hypothetical protein CRE_19468 [Caenorhabditis remanei]